MAARDEDRCVWVSERVRAFGYSAALCLRCGLRRNIRSEREFDDAPCPLELKERAVELDSKQESN